MAEPKLRDTAREKLLKPIWYFKMTTEKEGEGRREKNKRRRSGKKKEMMHDRLERRKK